MRRDTYQDVSQDGPPDGHRREPIRLSVPQAAERLGITQDAVRKRIKRGYIEWEKDEEGRRYVWVDPTETAKDTSSETSSETSRDVDDAVLLDYVETLKERVRHLEEESRRKDHLLAAALERIPAIEPAETPSEPRESPETASEEPYSTHAPPTSETPSSDTQRKRSWWRAFFGLE
jgi:DNA-binding MarR family transcriptional regulator